MEMTAFWDIASCSLVGVDRRFREGFCLHHQGNIWALMSVMEAVCTSETSFIFNENKWRYIPESCHLQNEINEEIKSSLNSANTCLHLSCFRLVSTILKIRIHYTIILYIVYSGTKPWFLTPHMLWVFENQVLTRIFWTYEREHYRRREWIVWQEFHSLWNIIGMNTRCMSWETCRTHWRDKTPTQKLGRKGKRPLGGNGPSWQLSVDGQTILKCILWLSCR
jgi:hypothetical protein